MLARARESRSGTSDTPSAAAAVASLICSTDRCDRHRSAAWIRSDRRRTRCGRAAAIPAGRRPECRREPSTRRPSPPVRAARTRCFQMRDHVLERQFFADAQRQRELAVEIRGSRFAAGPTATGAMVIGHSPEWPAATDPMARCSQISACGERFWCGRTSSAGIVCGALRIAAGPSRSKNVSIEFLQDLGLLVAIHDDEQGPLDRLPEQHEVERLRRRCQAGER